MKDSKQFYRQKTRCSKSSKSWWDNKENKYWNCNSNKRNLMICKLNLTRIINQVLLWLMKLRKLKNLMLKNVIKSLNFSLRKCWKSKSMPIVTSRLRNTFIRNKEEELDPNSCIKGRRNTFTLQQIEDMATWHNKNSMLRLRIILPELKEGEANQIWKTIWVQIWGDRYLLVFNRSITTTTR